MVQKSNYLSDPPGATQDAKRTTSTSPPADTDRENDMRPTYRPPGYPDFGNMWAQPPQALPGPDDHPFFRWIAAGAQKDPAVLATMSAQPSPAHPALPLRSIHNPFVVTQPREAFPYMPPPSVTMEPITPDLKPRTLATGAISPHRTPDLSTSPTEASPASAHTATPASEGKRPFHEDTEDKVPATEFERLGESAVHEEQQPQCTSAYCVWLRTLRTNKTNRAGASLGLLVDRSGVHVRTAKEKGGADTSGLQEAP